MCFTRISTEDQSVISKMLEALNLKNNAETRYRCQVSVYRTIGPLVVAWDRLCYLIVALPGPFIIRGLFVGVSYSFCCMG